ncbi:LysM peptidoglycan-binding domain-containing protein [Thalassotalea sp. PLHSN55]|uniref:lytic transglycosylase n=1 Tax=Thalassotalea sp. PLHSN55 TaxID=3435888 RepID=UPI003F853459
MKYYFPLTIAVSIMLGGCQSTPFQSEKSKQDQNSTLIADTATPAEVSLALLSDEANSVMHPIADVEFSVSDETQVTDDLWEDIKAKMAFDIPQNQRVVSQRNWYVKHASYLDRVAKRAEPFLYYIVQELEANDMPVEIALLPIVESAFDPFAYSHGRASGMWQFVPGTGERFGMKQNWWYDGRRDVIASTQGAIKYLKYLNGYFDGDWLLALAAYNSGEGRVRRAVKNNARKNKPTDFWSLDLPSETEAYVPKLLALADIIKRPADFNIELYDIQNKSVISQINIGSQLDLAKAAQLAELSLAELQHLNPGFNRWSTDPDGPHYLVIPNNKIEKFQAGLDKLSEKERLAWQRYQIKSGDSLSQIAKKFNTTTALIQQVNQIQGSQIRAGKYLLIPVATQALDSYIFSQEQRIAKKQSQSYNGTKLTHKVKSGDTLWDIGQAYKVSSKSIAKWNGMAPRDTLKVGQNLVIWQAKKSGAAANASSKQAIMRNITYKVRRGDSFARIADKFNVSIKDIERWNGLSSRKYLQPGQMLKLSVDVTNNI